MDPKRISQLLELITELVNEHDAIWSEKKIAVLAEASSDDETALEEFCSWFEEEHSDV